MKSDDLDVRNFKVRDNIEAEVNKHIQDQIKPIKLEGTLKSTVIDQGDQFSISTVAMVDKKIFSADAQFRKENTRKLSRNWQLEAIKKVFDDVIRQIIKAFNLTK